MKRPLSIGDRVAVYGPAEKRANGETHLYLRGDRGTVEDLIDENEINVQLDKDERLVTVHPRQCVRLKKFEPRRVWLHVGRVDDAIKTGEFDGTVIKREKPKHGTWAQFVEIKERK